jgi:hypothetical protein
VDGKSYSTRWEGWLLGNTFELLSHWTESGAVLDEIRDELTGWAGSSVGASRSVARRVQAAAIAAHGLLTAEFPRYRTVNPADYPSRAVAACEALVLARGVKGAVLEGNAAEAVSLALQMAAILTSLGIGPVLIAKRRSELGSAQGGSAKKKGPGLEAAARELVAAHGRDVAPKSLWEESKEWTADDPFTREGFDVYRDGDRLVQVAPDGRERSIGFDTFDKNYVRPLRQSGTKGP